MTLHLQILCVSSKNKDCLLHNHPNHQHAQKSDPASTRDLVSGPQSSILSVPRVSVRALHHVPQVPSDLEQPLLLLLLPLHGRVTVQTKVLQNSP